MDDRVEGNDAVPCPILNVKREHVALSELNPRIQSPSLLHHHRREVDPDDRDTSPLQISGYMPWTASEVADGSKSLDSCCELVK